MLELCWVERGAFSCIDSLEPDLNQRPMDVWQIQLQSTALPTELSRDVYCCRQQSHARCHRELSKSDLDFWMVHFQFSPTIHYPGDVAQMVERSLSMWEVGGSIPPVSKCFCSIFHPLTFWGISKKTGQLIWSKSRLRIRVKRNYWSRHKIDCIVRESNPGRPRGRRAFYHWTNDALLLLAVCSPDAYLTKLSSNKKIFAVGRIRTYARRAELISSQSP